MASQIKNWSGSLRFQPKEVLFPESEEQILDIVSKARQTQRKLRVVGSGHSWSPLVATDDISISLDRFQGIESIDRENRTCVVKAGTKLHRLSAQLHKHGLAMENLGDVDVQSLAGVVSTGTHGTGLRFGTISTQTSGLTIIAGNGNIVTCSEEEHPKWFKAAQLSLGALGILSKVELRLQPTYKLKAEIRRGNLDGTLERLQEYLESHRNFEFFWFPHSKHVMIKTLNETDEPVRGTGLAKRARELILENGMFWILSQVSRAFPAASARVSRLIGSLISEQSFVDHWHRVYATARLVKFNEMEYSIPLPAFKTVVREIESALQRHRFAVHFPIECRFVKGDDILISPVYGRESAYIAVHMFKGMAHTSYFAEMERIFTAHGGRPHFGKLHSLSDSNLRDLFPNWEAFKQIRTYFDPEGIFLNDHLKLLFGIGQNQKI